MLDCLLGSGMAALKRHRPCRHTELGLNSLPGAKLTVLLGIPPAAADGAVQ
jgi:hypothetical protein